MRVLRSSGLLLIVLLPGGLSTGCTGIGAAVGAAADRHKDAVVNPVGDAWEAHTLKDGEEIELRRRDGGVVRGRYRGLDWTLTETRLSRYEVIARGLARDLNLPAPGLGASLTLQSGQVFSGQLIGYTPAFVIFREEPQEAPVRVALDRVEELADAEGRSITGGRRLDEVLATAPIPVLADVRLEEGDATTVVPCEDVLTVGRVVRPTTGTKIGLILGAVVDAAVIVGIIYLSNLYD